MNFTMKFKEDTYIFTIKRILQERHGKIEDLKLCFHSFSEANEIQDEMLTLKDCGLKGTPVGHAETPEDKAAEEASIPVVQCFYDYRPLSQSDPVILHFR
jgi:2-iminoacetate synthase ThiH